MGGASVTRFVIDSPGLFVPARVAALLEPLIDAGRLRVHDAQLDAVLRDLAVVAAAYRERTSVARKFPGAAAEVGGRWSGELLTADDVAAEHNVTPHAVRLAARERRLRGSRDGSGWRFHRDDVEAWASTRPRSA